MLRSLAPCAGAAQPVMFLRLDAEASAALAMQPDTLSLHLSPG